MTLGSYKSGMVWVERSKVKVRVRVNINTAWVRTLPVDDVYALKYVYIDIQLFEIMNLKSDNKV